ncbi:MAG: ROK family protein [bacterium]
MQQSIGIDIGATKIIFVLLEDNQVLKKRKIKTPKNQKELVDALRKNITHLLPQKGVIAGIGIGVPSLLDLKREVVLNPPNLTCLKECPLPKIVKGCFEEIPVVMDNDANCFALAEACLGAGKDAEIVCGITLGSGLGGGIVKAKKIYRGAFGGAGEIGHMTIKFDGHQCICGGAGCFEEYASEKFFKRKKINSKELNRKASSGDKQALAIFTEFGNNLGIGLANVVNILEPEIIILGGGISKAGKYFIPAARAEAEKRIISPFSKKYVKIKKAKLGEFAGAIGAALLSTDNY